AAAPLLSAAGLLENARRPHVARFPLPAGGEGGSSTAAPPSPRSPALPTLSHHVGEGKHSGVPSFFPLSFFPPSPIRGAGRGGGVGVGGRPHTPSGKGLLDGGISPKFHVQTGRPPRPAAEASKDDHADRQRDPPDLPRLLRGQRACDRAVEPAGAAQRSDADV